MDAASSSGSPSLRHAGTTLARHSTQRPAWRTGKAAGAQRSPSEDATPTRPRPDLYGPHVHESHEVESVCLEWPATRVALGGGVTLTLVSEKPRSAPASNRNAPDRRAICWTISVQRNRSLMRARRSNGNWSGFWRRLAERTTAEERRTLGRAVGSVMAELGVRLLHPVFRNHPSLVPDQLRGEIL